MTFEWDPAKSAETLRRRGFDFAFASLIFESRLIRYPDDRHNYGELRWKVLGVVGDLFLTVIYTDRVGPDGAPVRRIISARHMSRNERRDYGEETPGATIHADAW